VRDEASQVMNAVKYKMCETSVARAMRVLGGSTPATSRTNLNILAVGIAVFVVAALAGLVVLFGTLLKYERRCRMCRFPLCG
jgi:hypothetical protein